MTFCKSCGKVLTQIESFKCDFCQETFCSDHRLAESHSCLKAPERTPLGNWKAKPEFDDYVTQSQILGITKIKAKKKEKSIKKRLKSLFRRN